MFFCYLLAHCHFRLFRTHSNDFTELGKMDRKSVWISLAIIFIVGFPTIMAHGSWSDILIGGRNFFDL